MHNAIGKEECIRRVKQRDGISFIGLVNEDRFRLSDRVVVSCDKCLHVWSPTISKLTIKKTGYPKCNVRRLKTLEERVSELPEGIEITGVIGEFTGAMTTVSLLCNKGHSWTTNINNIVNHRSGCPSCASHGFDKCKMATLYAIVSDCGRMVKVGISNDKKTRYRSLRRETPFGFHVEMEVYGIGSEIAKMEKYIHKKYTSAGLSGFGGCTEWLIFDQEIINDMKIMRLVL